MTGDRPGRRGRIEGNGHQLSYAYDETTGQLIGYILREQKDGEAKGVVIFNYDNQG